MFLSNKLSLAQIYDKIKENRVEKPEDQLLIIQSKYYQINMCIWNLKVYKRDQGYTLTGNGIKRWGRRRY